MTFKQKIMLLIAFLLGVMISIQLEKYLCPPY